MEPRNEGNLAVTDNGITITPETIIVDKYFAHISFSVKGYDLAEGDEPGFDDWDIGVKDDKTDSNMQAYGGFYDGILFHRVIDGFMIQFGDPWTKDPCRTIDEYGWGDQGFWIPAEFVDGLRHKRGALAAAREGDDVNPEKMSSSSQFYLVQNEEECKRLDGNYTVFGETIDGFDVIDAIAKVPRGAKKLDMPNDPVKIVTITLVDDGKGK